MFSNQPSYTVDSQTGSNGKVVPVLPGGGSRGIAPRILNLGARHIEWSTSCCIQSSCPHPGEITSDINGMGGWVGSRASLMF
jgi:hypothetical protein